ncbi:MAG: type I-E CRISPR-associated protein Cas7/Cse4/CasC [Desulfofustis sp. PB-SRB1]|jgi:CRISPR system Cascade subunit CasC|nr:type I-E CRISPR-associated protein Cas7/Cse4/CasC [Desulfofustis sp. PB-SRB1]
MKTSASMNTRIEYHILQSFPVTCLNRDDVGAPKSAMVGGVTRARVSSQCWKRQVRMALAGFGVKLGTRTKKVTEFMEKACQESGADTEKAAACAKKIAQVLSDDTLLFIGQHEADAFAFFAMEHGFELDQLTDKQLTSEITKVVKKNTCAGLDALDIALFGRMVAKAADLNVEAAASFSHAISTHRVSNEVEFFTALDDLSEEPGSAHMGSLEYNAATYYRYISLDLGQLGATLDEEGVKQAVEVFTKALYVAVPSARQTTQSGASPWEFAKILVRQGQRLQVPFETPVQLQRGGGYFEPSKEKLKEYLLKKEKLSGSLFGKKGDYEWGENEDYSIDNLIEDLQGHVRELY